MSGVSYGCRPFSNEQREITGQLLAQKVGGEHLATRTGGGSGPLLDTKFKLSTTQSQHNHNTITTQSQHKHNTNTTQTQHKHNNTTQTYKQTQTQTTTTIESNFILLTIF